MNIPWAQIRTDAGNLAKVARAKAAQVPGQIVGAGKASGRYGLAGGGAGLLAGYMASDRGDTGARNHARAIAYAAGGAAAGVGAGIAVKTLPGAFRSAGRGARSAFAKGAGAFKKSAAAPAAAVSMADFGGTINYAGHSVGGVIDRQGSVASRLYANASSGITGGPRGYQSLKNARSAGVRVAPLTNEAIADTHMGMAQQLSQSGAPALSSSWLPNAPSAHDAWGPSAFIGAQSNPGGAFVTQKRAAGQARYSRMMSRRG